MCAKSVALCVINTNHSKCRGTFMEVETDAQDEINTLFEKNRQRLRLEFRGDHSHAARVFDQIIDRKMMQRLMASEEAEPSDRFQPSSKKRLNYLYGAHSDTRIYDGLSSKISQNPEDAVSLLKTVRGEYVYYRHFSANTDPKKQVDDAEIQKGRIEIFGEDGRPKLHHWSHNWDSVEPEHTGYVFQSGTNMFMLGMSAGVMRLAISNIPRKPNDLIVGIIASVRSAFPHNPFGARFVMVRKENEAIQSLLDESNPGRRAEFHRITKGEYSWLMLSYHP